MVTREDPITTVAVRGEPPVFAATVTVNTELPVRVVGVAKVTQLESAVAVHMQPELADTPKE
jgi:hypothetical protein